MSSLASSNPNETSATTTVRRELIIASSFVKSYYTLLNKGPQYIHNFYSDHSSFIHGSVEIPNDNQTGPVVGRDNIHKKIQELNLHDCRAKITQIDCLETLSEGLLIQVSGELSNNGQPMRRFMQTFVLARSRDENSKSDDATISTTTNSTNATPSSQQTQRRNGESLSHPSSSSPNEKFYVRNSIFRYQDDLSESEIEDEPKVESQSSANISPNKANISAVQADGDHKADMPAINNSNEPKVVSQSSANNISQSKNNTSSVQQADGDRKSALPANNLSEQKVVYQSSANISPSKTDTPLAQADSDHKSALPPINNNISNEPKTWANMVRSSQQQLTSPVSKVTSTQPSKPAVVQQEQQQPINHNQSSVNQQQNQQSRRRLNRKSSNNKGPGGNRPANKLRTSRLNTTTTSNTAPSKQ